MLDFIIILLVLFFLVRLIGRMFMVSTFGAINKKVEDEFKRRQQPSRPEREGHISVDKSVRDKKGKDNHDDEYIDFEEIK